MGDSAPQRPDGTPDGWVPGAQVPGAQGPGDAPSWSSPAGAPSWSSPAGAPSWSVPVDAPGGWGGPAQLPPGRRPGDRRSVVPLRPLGVGEMLDGAVGVVRAYPRPVFAVGAAVAVLGATLQLIVVLTLLRPILLDAERAGDQFQTSAGSVASAGVGLGITALFTTFTALLLAGLVAPAVSRGLLAESLSPRDAWQQLRPRLGALAGVSLLVTLVVAALPAAGVGLTLLAAATMGEGAAALLGLLLVGGGLVLAALLYIRWAFAPLCVVLEKQGARAALGRSSQLVARSWWRVLGVLVLTAIVAAVVAQILQLPFAFLSGGSGSLLSGATSDAGATFGSAVGAAVAGTVVGPFVACVRGLLYADRRMRAEGLDVALAAAISGPRPAPGGP